MTLPSNTNTKSTPATFSSSMIGTTDAEFSFSPNKFRPHKLLFSHPQQQEEQQQHQQQEQQDTYDCTCAEPPAVILFDDSNDEKEKKNIFIENLRTHGWSPIIVSEAPNPSPSQEEILAIFRRRRQRQPKTNTEKNDRDVVFIAAESGSSEGTIEPKESLEVQLSKCVTQNTAQETKYNYGDDTDDIKNRRNDFEDERTIKIWCKTLSWIAHKICRLVLDVPKNTFLPDDPCESLDLLRVFHYYAEGKNQRVSQSSPTLGSSEHTDWGSLTVVWQDSVGGLQTYCRACQKWIDVKAASTTGEEMTIAGATESKKEPSHRWECIVHVGDMSSLVLERSSNTEKLSNDIEAKNTANTISHSWPSPRHRVQCNPHKERVSLVYFGYPPRGLSLERIQNHLDQGWRHFSTRGQKLPLKEYYLLRNQSVAKKAGAVSVDEDIEARRLYRTMWNLPIQDIVRLKWEQVNRDG